MNEARHCAEQIQAVVKLLLCGDWYSRLRQCQRFSSFLVFTLLLFPSGFHHTATAASLSFLIPAFSANWPDLFTFKAAFLPSFSRKPCCFHEKTFFIFLRLFRSLSFSLLIAHLSPQSFGTSLSSTQGMAALSTEAQSGLSAHTNVDEHEGIQQSSTVAQAAPAFANNAFSHLTLYTGNTMRTGTTGQLTTNLKKSNQEVKRVYGSSRSHALDGFFQRVHVLDPS